MKQLSYFMPLAALLMFASCQKEDNPSESPVKDPVFTATIANDGTKTSLDLSTKKVSWALKDEITVTDAKSTSVKYEVSAIDGTTGAATITKKSGESGTLGAGPYTATYGEAPSTSQTYTATDGLQNVTKLPMSAPSTSGTSLTFTVSCGLLKVTLTQTGISISSIAVSNGTDTYTLTCNDAVSIASGATFYIAVPAGTYTSFKFTESNGYVSWRSPLSIEVTKNHIKPVSSTFGPEYKENGTLYGYGSKINGYWWAPVNCGYDASHTYGLLYQFGRKVGGGYDSTEGMQEATAATYTEYSLTKLYNKNPDDTKFYYTQDNSPCDWYTNDSGNQLPSWPMKSGDAGYVGGKIANPCPTGWRVPTYAELNALVGNQGSTGIGGAGWDGTNAGYWFNGTTSPESGKGLFLPAAGCLDYYDGSAYSRGSNGGYWSSSVDGNVAKYLLFKKDSARMNSYDVRANGYSVRCVQE